MAEKTFKITSETGLHARPATLVVNKAGQFQSDIQIGFKGKSVNLKSIMGVMSLGVAKGDEVSISVDGNDADDALKSLEDVMTSEKIGEVKA